MVLSDLGLGLGFFFCVFALDLGLSDSFLVPFPIPFPTPFSFFVADSCLLTNPNGLRVIRNTLREYSTKSWMVISCLSNKFRMVAVVNFLVVVDFNGISHV